jgi:enterochelin esterase-like enzyme
MNVLGNYDIVIDADGWALAGHSSGGIASIIAGFYHSDRWHKILTASPSFPNKGGNYLSPVRYFRYQLLQAIQRRCGRNPERVDVLLPLSSR